MEQSNENENIITIKNENVKFISMKNLWRKGKKSILICE
jgi:hypothetical protein